jgi:Tetratricopeptide repeat/Cytochrome c554 and c-prime
MIRARRCRPRRSISLRAAQIRHAGDTLDLLRFVYALLLAIAFGADGAESVGSQACASCHAAIYRSFMRTPMAHSSGRAGTSEIQEQFDRTEFTDSGGAFAYTVGHNTSGYYFDFRQQGAKQPIKSQPIQGRRSLDYFVGSGNAAHSYLTDVDGFLYEAPVAFFRNLAAWKSAPGVAELDYPYLTRPILPGCLQCHASGIRRIAGTQNAYASPPFSEGGVACERCHGPGSEHIAAGKPMVNPAKLAPAARDSICEQCHLSGEIRVPKQGSNEPVLSPGDRLADSLTVFVRSGSGAQLRVTSHAENLAQSLCKRKSGDKLWCGTCHDPHSVPSANQKAAYFRGKCLTCHQTSSCSAPQTLRQANGDDCIACHMPRNPTSDVDHVVFTDHSIPRRPMPGRAEPSVDADLEPYGGGEVSARDLGLAYVMVALREGNAVYRERAFRLLQDAVAQGARDAQTLLYLAQLYRDRKDDAHARPLYEEVWRMDREQYAAGAALGAYQMQAGNLDEAIRLWRQTLAISPALVLVRQNLATALLRTGRPDQAQENLRKALEFNPAFQPAKDLLNQIVK